MFPKTLPLFLSYDIFFPRGEEIARALLPRMTFKLYNLINTLQVQNNNKEKNIKRVLFFLFNEYVFNIKLNYFANLGISLFRVI